MCIKHGNYVVVVTSTSGCCDTPSCITISNVSLSKTESSNITLYPNPTPGQVTLRFNNELTYTVLVYDISGKIIHSELKPSNELHVYLGSNSGAYTVKAKSDNRTMRYKLPRLGVISAIEVMPFIVLLIHFSFLRCFLLFCFPVGINIIDFLRISFTKQ